MKEQFIYVVHVTNRYTREHYVKVGYSADVLKRMEQLERKNVHYEYSNCMLFKHTKKQIGYIHDEQLVHRMNKKNRTYLKDSMPEGHSECYEYWLLNELIQLLTKLSYVCVYNESQPVPIQVPMFVWQ